MRKEEWECILELIDCRLADETAEYMSKYTGRKVRVGTHTYPNKTRKRPYYWRIDIDLLAFLESICYTIKRNTS